MSSTVIRPTGRRRTRSGAGGIQAVRLKPDLPIAHYYLAQGLKHFGHIAEAQTEMASAARLGDDTFRAAMTAKVRNKEEERKYDMAHPRKGVDTFRCDCDQT